MITSKQIENIVKENIIGTGIFIVEINISQENSIIVRLDHPNGLSIDSCVKISRQIESSLNRDIEDYSLEVTSAGIGEPFKVKQQYEKIIGRKIEIILKNGRKIIETLNTVDDCGITISQNKPKYSKNALKMLPKEEQEIIKNEQNLTVKLTWEEIKSVTEHINFQ